MLHKELVVWMALPPPIISPPVHKPQTVFDIPGTGSGVDKWYIHHEGGGWCESLENCYGRSLGRLGSSKSYTPTIGLPGGYFSNNVAENPTMYNWNKVFFAYCDGGSFAGNNANVERWDGHDLFFRGFQNLQAYLRSLKTLHKLGSSTDVVISGCSAGGLATYLHVDWWKENLPSMAKVRGLPDSGFFLDFNSKAPNGPKYGDQMRWVFKAMNASAGVNQLCIKSNPAAQENCYFAEHTSPYIKTPIFPLQSEYDAWQVPNILGAHPTDDAAINEFGKLLTQRITKAVFSNPANGAFLDSCYHHCGRWDSIVIDGRNTSTAFADFYEGRSPHVFIQGRPYPCVACCSP